MYETALKKFNEIDGWIMKIMRTPKDENANLQCGACGNRRRYLYFFDLSDSRKGVCGDCILNHCFENLRPPKV
jgi:hypothetical protein